jgi:putative MFS transporter
MKHNAQLTTNAFNATVIVAALGYFVDIYDLILFGIVRTPSLQAIGLQGDQLTQTGITLLNVQMAGMLIGGLLWGIWGDVKGRVSVLFGSIFLYSIANIANAFVADMPGNPVAWYAFFRLIAGIGLAGELGAGITLVNETMTKETRGYGTMIVVTFGALGAVVAALVGDIFGSWKIAYIVGGILGLLLLALRISTYESGMFHHARTNTDHTHARFWDIFSTRANITKYLASIAVGIPIWFAIGILIVLSPELSREIGVTPTIKAGTAILYAYIGLSAGDLLSGILSQWMRSRKKVIWMYLVSSVAITIAYLLMRQVSANLYYFTCFLIGASTGFWALFVTMASEQFGTNIRSTVTTTVPNFVRGSVIPLTAAYQTLHTHYAFSITTSALIVGITSILLAGWGLSLLQDTFGKDLNYLEKK